MAATQDKTRENMPERQETMSYGKSLQIYSVKLQLPLLTPQAPLSHPFGSFKIKRCHYHPTQRGFTHRVNSQDGILWAQCGIPINTRDETRCPYV